MEAPPCIVLFSGGLDSSTVIAIAKEQGFLCHALTVAYGQLHDQELAAATRVATALKVHQHKILQLDLAPLATSALTDRQIAVPKDRSPSQITAETTAPATYVPARNTVLLSLGLSWAESIGATDLFLGVNVLDASGYPDCRPEFVERFEALANVATVAGTQGKTIRIHAPLIQLTKADIIRQGISLGVDYSMTHSCYAPGLDGGGCRRCDACVLRAKGFAEANVPDPTRYSAAAE